MSVSDYVTKLKPKKKKKKKKPLGYLSMDFGCKIDKLFQQVILFMQLVLQ
jgi:hypothetical protein